MKRVALQLFLAISIALFGVSQGVAFADIDDSEATNLQEGDNSGESAQNGAAGSGDAVGGQVTGIVSSGDTSVDARNRSEDADVESGDAAGTNTSSSFTGLNDSGDTSVGDPGLADITGSCNDGGCSNVQEGDNDFSLTQTSSATSGDGVGGQVIGAVTSAGGSADIVAANDSEDVDIETGDTFSDNAFAAFTGMNSSTNVDVSVFVSDIEGTCESSGCANLQEGDNATDATQDATASSGDGVGGQVIGAVSAGDTSIDASNSSEDVDISTGVAHADNDAAMYTGLNTSTFTDVGQAGGLRGQDIVDTCESGDGCTNVQEGDNDTTANQTATAASGDGVGGSVIGAVTAAGGSADIVAANESEDVDVDTGDALTDNQLSAYTGMNSSTNIFIGDAGVGAVDIEDACQNGGGCGNVQEGDNEATFDQTADASSGDGVAGQVIGAVSAGDTSIDARNRSEDADISTGVADASNEAAGVTGLNSNFNESGDGGGVVSSDIHGCHDADTCHNLQEGDNTTDVTQNVTASSGDGVGGQVIGAVTSAGGSADIVADNGSEDVDVDTGDAAAENSSASYVGLSAVEDFNTITASNEEEVVVNDIFRSCFNVDGCQNLQEGDNDATIDQTADASSGDGVAGQVIGAVSAGDTSIDARNRSEDVGVDTGDADAANDSASFTGLLNVDDGGSLVEAEDIEESCFDGSDCDNVQEGDNETNLTQNVSASSGDGVGGQVIGAVTSAGGSADIVAENTSEDVDAETGEASAENDAATFVGLLKVDFNTITTVEEEPLVQDIVDSCEDTGGNCENVQEGDNALDGAQNADASSGDAVAGQVLGAVSAGDTSIDASNESIDSDAESGPAEANNDAAVLVGLASVEGDSVVGSDIEGVSANNLQEGDNDASFDQMADASSGDAVAGQVAGAVTSAGGSADAVLENSSEDIDAETGESTFDDTYSVFVGQSFAEDDLLIGLFAAQL